MNTPTNVNEARRQATCFEKAQADVKAGKFTFWWETGEKVFVDSKKPEGGWNRYEVNLDAQTCTCPDFTGRGYTCKHILAAEMMKVQAEETEEAESCEMDVETYRRWKEENEARY